MQLVALLNCVPLHVAVSAKRFVFLCITFIPIGISFGIGVRAITSDFDEAKLPCPMFLCNSS